MNTTKKNIEVFLLILISAFPLWSSLLPLFEFEENETLLHQTIVVVLVLVVEVNVVCCVCVVRGFISRKCSIFALMIRTLSFQPSVDDAKCIVRDDSRNTLVDRMRKRKMCAEGGEWATRKMSIKRFNRLYSSFSFSCPCRIGLDEGHLIKLKVANNTQLNAMRSNKNGINSLDNNNRKCDYMAGVRVKGNDRNRNAQVDVDVSLTMTNDK